MTSSATGLWSLPFRSRNVEVMEEVCKYIEETGQSLECLQDFPRMKQLFLRHNTTPVQPLFSPKGNRVTSQRNFLTDDYLERIQLLGFNINVCTLVTKWMHCQWPLSRSLLIDTESNHLVLKSLLLLSGQQISWRLLPVLRLGTLKNLQSWRGDTERSHTDSNSVGNTGAEPHPQWITHTESRGQKHRACKWHQK